MAQLLKNNAFSTLALPLASGATSMTLVDASGFPSPTGGNYFLATLVGYGTNGAENAWEIVRCTARASNTLTVVRAQEGTADASWSAATQVQMRLTAGSMATKADLASPAFTGTVTGITKAMVGLSNVDDTADTAKPVSTAQQAALNLKANLAGPAFTGAPTAPTAATGTNTTQVATTAFVNAEIASDAAPIAHVGSGGAAHANAVASGAAGFMTGADKAKLDGVAAGANNYSHPAKHPPSIITQDASNRFVTDAEKSAWNAKQAALVSGTNIKSINGSSVLGSGNIDIAAGVTDAPSDGKNYARKDGAWAEIVAGGSGKIARVARTSNTTLSAEDNGKLIDITSGTFTQTFDSAATLGSGWWCYLGNSGTGDITLDPNGAETIDGLTSYVMYPGEMRLVQCDGSSLRTVVLKAFRKVFTSSGTFTKPPNYKTFFGLVVGGGGGGGGGNRGAFSYPYPGGAGGGGGARAFNTFQAAQFNSSTVITVGAGGSGGPSSSADNQGTSGTSGGSSSIDGLLYASGGAFASGNSEGAGGNGGAGGVFYWDTTNGKEAFHVPGINGIGAGSAPSNPAKLLTSCGGGNGGAVTTGNTPNAGVRGVGISNSSGLSEILGGAGGAVGNPGSVGVSGAGYVGTGGGGGASTATTGYSGGAGGWPGGGGGGGGGGVHGNPGSTGGDGAAGTVVIEGIV